MKKLSLSFKSITNLIQQRSQVKKNTVVVIGTIKLE